jgi:DNA repair protein RadD
MISLWPFQQSRMFEPVRQAFREGSHSTVLVAPTGSGKTRVMAAMAEAAASKGNTTTILAHRVELIDQITGALIDLGIVPDIVAAGYERRDSPVMVASVPTLIKRLDSITAPKFLMADETHHAVSATWKTIIERWRSAKLLGVTATPLRLDGKGLAPMFDRMVIGPTVAELTPEYLAPARVWAPPTIDISGLHTARGDYIIKEAEERANRPGVTGDALTHYREHADGKPALAFCVSVQHATDVAQQFREAGYSAVMLKGGMDRDLRRQALADFRAGKIQVITSVDIFTEGTDLPGVHVGIVLRPTQSLALWRQICGRILRRADSKDAAILLDHAGNCERFGRPIDEPQWALTYDESKRKRNASLQARICHACFSANAARAFVCTNCGERFRVAPRSEIEEHEGELVEITAEMLAKRQARRDQGRSESLEDLIALGHRRGMRNPEGWARHVIEGRAAKRVRQ